MDECLVVIESNGKVRFLYDDSLQDVSKALGKTSTVRASHIDPADDGMWYADLSPVGGPKLGPFITRASAIEAEVSWLEANNIPEPIKQTVKD